MWQKRIVVFFIVLFGAFTFFMQDDVSEINNLATVYDGNVIKFQDAEFTGEDSERKEYMLIAKEAKSVNQDQYWLESVNMSYDFQEKGDLIVTSSEGEYDKSKQIFTGLGQVKVNLQNQYFISTNKLSAKLYDRIISTDEPIDFEGSGLFIHSKNGMKVDISKKVIECYGPIYSRFSDF
jgi:LPS export ABC transporter protein LptC